MRAVFKTSILFLLLVLPCLAQDPKDPMPVTSSSWRRTVQKAADPVVPTTGPARAITVDDTIINRSAREFRTDHPTNPSEETPDGRSQQIEKNVEQSRAPKGDDVMGFTYNASVRNESGQTVKVIFWEYTFTEIAHPANVVRRQFLCGVDLKKGQKMELTAFSTLGPSDIIDAKSLETPDNKLFKEQVQINRLELSDDSILQRGNWKYEEMRPAIQRATSTPWGKEVCRAL
jgi:hypothetical protein